MELAAEHLTAHFLPSNRCDAVVDKSMDQAGWVQMALDNLFSLSVPQYSNNNNNNNIYK